MGNIIDRIDLVLGEQQGNSKYQEFFREKMKEWGINSPQDLDEKKRKQFFEDVKKGWNKKQGE